MPQAKPQLQRSVSPRGLQHGWMPDPGVRLTSEEIKKFLDACREKGLTEGTIEWYRRGLKHLHEDLPEDKTIRHGTLEHWQEELVRQGYPPLNSKMSTKSLAEAGFTRLPPWQDALARYLQELK